MKKSKFHEEEQNIQSGSPCNHDDCVTSKKKPCPYCGRINMRGNVHIQHRTGFVHFERLNETYKKLHTQLSEEEQENSTVELWIGPNF